MGSEGEGEGGPGQWKALDFVLNFKTMNSAKKTVWLFFIWVYVPKLFYSIFTFG